MSRRGSAQERSLKQTKTTQSKPLGKLEEYSVQGLFGSRDIDFRLDDRAPTLLTGVNGTGKSTVLRTIDAISTGRWTSLFEIPFRRLTLSFGSGDTLVAEQDSEQARLVLEGEEPWVWNRSAWQDVRLTLDKMGLDRGVDWGTQIKDIYNNTEPEVAYYLASLDVADPQIRRRLRNTLLHMGQRPPDVIPTWVQTFSKRFPVLFITDQRLVIEPRGPESSSGSEAKPTRVAAEEAARHIADEIGAAQARYASRSQSLDRTSPKRVIGAMSQPTQVGEDDLRAQLSELSQLRQSLQRSGLLPQDVTEEFEDLDLSAPHVRAYVATYVTDMSGKLSVLEPLRRRLALFTEFLSQHYGNKVVTVDQQNGFVISVEGQEGPLPPVRLSSGEQQILVLAHHILFRAEPGTLVLIDEPELSLHVIWQATLVDDLTEMGKERDLSFLLATHSPTLLAGREDLKRSLDG